MAITYLDEISEDKIKGRNALVRVDFNVPLDKETGKISDASRIEAALPTIEYLLDKGVKKLILMSHLGRPKAQRNPKESLEPVATYLAEKINQDVVLTESATDRGIKTLLGLNTDRILLLENLRFHPEEEANDTEFARKLASYADFYVNDAFGTAHRKHASTYAVVGQFRKTDVYAGLLLKKEILGLDKVTHKPKKPFVGIVGGAKISDKIKIIEKLLMNVDHLLIGGAMAYPFLKAQGLEVGTSLCQDEDVELAKKILKLKSASKIKLPQDHVVASSPQDKGETTSGTDIPEGKMGLDIGPLTLEDYRFVINQAETVLWNGPMGFFESEAFSAGTFQLAKFLSESKAYTLVGGGDSVSAVQSSGLVGSFSHVSTGGGASLEYIEKGTLPGIQALKFGLS